MNSVPGDTPHFNFGLGQFALVMAVFVLVFLLQGIASLLARNAKTRRGGIVGLVVTPLLLASLPVWGTAVFLLLASFGENSQALRGTQAYAFSWRSATRFCIHFQFSARALA